MTRRASMRPRHKAAENALNDRLREYEIRELQ